MTIPESLTWATPQSASWDRRNEQFTQLLARAREGSIPAFEELYDSSAGWLLAVIRRIVRDGQAEDVLAEVYLQVWRSLHLYDATRGPPAVWLATLARSRALDHLRREKQRAAETMRSTEAGPEAATTEDPEWILTCAQQAKLLHLSVARLDRDEQVVIGLAYFRDCTQAEIARITGLPLGTVKTAMARARQKLRKYFMLSVEGVTASAALWQAPPYERPSTSK